MYLSEQNNSAINTAMKYTIIAMSAIGTAMILGWLLKYSFFGIDFTDESFYLVWMSNPFIYAASATQFGFVYYPLYVLLNGDIAELRQANILITFGLGWALVYTSLVSLAPKVDEQRLALHVSAAGLATSSLILFNTWLSTPSYNSLAFQALLITGIGVLLADKAASSRSSAGWILVGVGGWLSFMAKPSTAAALAVGVLICLVVSRRFSLRLFLLAVVVASGLLLLSAFLIDGSVSGFVKRLLLGVEAGRLLGGGHTASGILRIDRFRLNTPSKLAILLVLALSSLAAYGILSKRPKDAIISLVLSACFLAVTALVVLGLIKRTAGLGEFEGLLIFGVSFSAAFSGLILGKYSPLKTVPWSHWVVAILFLVMPYIYAFGTNRNYWENGAWAGIFWLVSGVTLLGPVARERSNWSFLLPLALATQATTAVLVHTGLELPTRQDQALRLNDTAVEIGPHRSTLILSRGYATYINEAEAAARNGGFTSGTPVIDLSGQSPGILYAIGAESIGQAWTIGGYPGSLSLAKAALDHVPCEKIAKAWVLFEPGGPRSIPTEIMPSLGSAFPERYEMAGAWRTAEGAGGYDARRVQELYRPTASIDTMKACQNLRAGE